MPTSFLASLPQMQVLQRMKWWMYKVLWSEVDGPVTATEVSSATKSDPVLSKVLRYVREGWMSDVPDGLKPYYHRRTELSVEDDLLLWNDQGVLKYRELTRTSNPAWQLASRFSKRFLRGSSSNLNYLMRILKQDVH